MEVAVKSPLEMFYQWEKTTPNKVFLRQPTNLVWAEFTWAQIGDQVRRLTTFIDKQNYPPGSRIAIWSSNSMDWVVVDLAIMMSGHTSVPVYPGQDIKSARYILEHSESQMIFLGDFDHADDADEAIPGNVSRVAIRGATTPCQFSLAEIIATHEPRKDSPIPDPDGLITMVYTSGTTGNPKGVMHLHSTAGHTMPQTIAKLLKNSPEPTFFSFLPLSHIAERVVVEFTCLYSH